MGVRLVVQRSYKADKKEPLAEQLRRVAALLDDDGSFTVARLILSDPLVGRSSPVARAVSRHAQLAPLQRGTQVFAEPGAVDLDLVCRVANGVPRSFPFGTMSVTFRTAPFLPVDLQADGTPGSPGAGVGVTVEDWAWHPGRKRTLTVSHVVDVPDDAAAADPPELASFFTALGKPVRQEIAPFGAVLPLGLSSLLGGAIGTALGPTPGAPVSVVGQADAGREAVREIEARYRRTIAEQVLAANLPHVLSQDRQPPGISAGELKPALVAAFKPRGYSCKKRSGEFELLKRSPAGYEIALTVDVGTWSRLVMARLALRLTTHHPSIPLPLTSDAAVGQLPIGGSARWGQIVDNLAAVVDQLETTFISDLDAAAGPAPTWLTEV